MRAGTKVRGRAGMRAGRYEGGQARGRGARARAGEGGRAGTNERGQRVGASGHERGRVQTQVRAGGEAMSSLPTTLDIF